MSTVTRVQRLLGVIADAKVNNHPLQMITSRLGNESDTARPAAPVDGDALPDQPAATAAWDPHEVWVNRVKKPRDQRSA